MLLRNTPVRATVVVLWIIAIVAALSASIAAATENDEDRCKYLDALIAAELYGQAKTYIAAIQNDPAGRECAIAALPRLVSAEKASAAAGETGRSQKLKTALAKSSYYALTQQYDEANKALAEAASLAPDDPLVIEQLKTVQRQQVDAW